ncbi:MAG: hypothetical protein AAGG68_30205 [Bacteroidota bacterium]
MDNKNDLQLSLEEKFKALLPKEDAPEELKKEVFQTLDTLNLVGDIVDLFTDKFIQTEATFWGLDNKEEEQ